MNAERKKIKYITGLMAVLLMLSIAFMSSNVQAEESSPVSTRTQTVENNEEIVRFDYQSDAVNVLVTLTNPADLSENAQLSVTPVEISEDMQARLDQEAISKQKAIESASAFDIKFLVDGQEMQPGNTVKVQVTLPEITAGTDADVYHFDETAKTTEDMNAAVTPEGQVEFDTTHFSTYIIVNTSGADVQVIIEHYNEAYTVTKTRDKLTVPGGRLNGTYQQNADYPENEIYAADKLTLKPGTQIGDYTKALNWSVSRVVEINNDGSQSEIEDISKIQVTKDTTYRVYYKPLDIDFLGAAKFYDYTVKPKDGYEKSINNNSNYRDSLSTNRITAGTQANNYRENRWGGVTAKNKNLNVNVWTGNGTNTQPVRAVEGIVTGLAGEKYQDVIFDNGNLDDPGLFSDTEKIGKTIYSDYKLKFKKFGDTYTLTNVLDKNAKSVASAGQGFFPLDRAEGVEIKNDLSNEGSHNDFFGMRYDVNFTLGDYIGPLNYSFSGDDDLWVILDGDKVVIDIGGIHNCLSKEVNLWEYIKDADGNYDKDSVHTLTVLYMERGAGDSDCRMEFTLPNASVLEVTDVPKADLNFTKVASDKTITLSGAGFKLVNDETKSEQTATSGADGNVNFKNLAAGTYTLTETIAPGGYTASSETWKVEVTENSDGKTATAKLYQADGITPVEENKIINYTSQEIIDKTIESNKTATVNSWDDRTYNIHLDASSKVEETVKSNTPYDIVLVLDSSASMMSEMTGHTLYNNDEKVTIDNNYYYKTDSGIFQQMDRVADEKYNTDYYKYNDADSGTEMRVEVTKNTFDLTDAQNGRIYWAPKYSSASSVTKQQALESAATSFLDAVNEKSPDSRVGVVIFGNDSEIRTTEDTTYTMLKVGEKNSINTLKEWIKINPAGATPADKGLENAEKVFSETDKWQTVSQTDGREKLVVFFTDGVPTQYTAFDENVAKKAIESSRRIKENATIYSIGIFNDTNSKGWLNSADVNRGTIKQVDDYMKAIASPNCYMTTDNMEELESLFGEIVANMGKAIKGATITDVIDNRFKLTPESKEKLENEGAKIVENADGTTTITWENQTINAKTSSGRAGWTADLKVVAREDYIGDNNVPTNAPGSGIDCGIDAFVPFPQPTVNVKADISLLNQENTIFWDETVPASGALIDRVNALQTLIDKNVKDYKVPENSLNIVWTNKDGEVSSIEAMTQDKPEKDTAYNVTVTYNASPATEISNANTKGDKIGVKSDNSQNTINARGQYDVHVVKGQLQITKKIEEQYTNIKQINANQTFVFKIERYEVDQNGNKGKLAETFYETINFNANETGTEKTKLVSGLKKGYYTVTEESNWSQKYKLDNKTDNFEGNQEETADLLIGKHLKEAANNNGKPEFYGLDETKLKDNSGAELPADQQYSHFAEGSKATVEFTNKLNTNWKWLSDTAAAVNIFDGNAQ